MLDTFLFADKTEGDTAYYTIVSLEDYASLITLHGARKSRLPPVRILL